MLVDGEHHFLRRNMKLVRRSISDSLVGLVRNEPVDVLCGGAGRFESIHDYVGYHAEGMLEHLADLHPEISHRTGRGWAAIDIKFGLVPPVGAQMGGQYSAIGGLAGLRL